MIVTLVIVPVMAVAVLILRADPVVVGPCGPVAPVAPAGPAEPVVPLQAASNALISNPQSNLASGDAFQKTLVPVADGMQTLPARVNQQNYATDIAGSVRHRTETVMRTDIASVRALIEDGLVKVISSVRPK